MLLGDPAADVETETCTGDVPRLRSPIEGCEEAAALLLRHPDTTVRHADHRFGADDGQRDVDRRARWAVLERVIQNIAKDLCDPIRIALDADRL